VCRCDAEIDENVTPTGIETAVGILVFVVVPLPSLPYPLSPQQYAFPLVLIAHVSV
jgi:hypothetical protein